MQQSRLRVRREETKQADDTQATSAMPIDLPPRHTTQGIKYQPRPLSSLRATASIFRHHRATPVLSSFLGHLLMSPRRMVVGQSEWVIFMPSILFRGSWYMTWKFMGSSAVYTLRTAPLSWPGCQASDWFGMSGWCKCPSRKQVPSPRP